MLTKDEVLKKISDLKAGIDELATRLNINRGAILAYEDVLKSMEPSPEEVLATLPKE